MASFPEELVALVCKAAIQHLDPAKAVDCAEKLVCKHPDFNDWQSSLVRHALLELVYDVRHRANIATRKDSGDFGGEAKVTLASGGVASALSRSPYLSYFIAGRCLGDIAGEELSALADSERATAETATFHARLLTKLAAAVPEGKRVRDCYTDGKLKRLFTELNPKAKRKAA